MVGDPLRFSESWIDAWNSHDLERILAHYEDDFLLESPHVIDARRPNLGPSAG